MFEIVVVCTGNRCRSPLVEALINSRTSELPVRARSVGLLELGSAPALPEALDLARSLGLDLSEHRARHLAAGDLSAADLVIGLEREHVAAAVVDGGAAHDRTFTLIEIVDLLGSIDVPREADLVERARLAVARADGQRRGRRFHVPGLDIPDPFGRPRKEYVALGARLADLCGRLVEALFGALKYENRTSRDPPDASPV